MRRILIILSVPLALIAAASPALARPGISNGGSTDQSRYANCYATTMAKIINDAARNLNIAQRTKAISTASATADKACQPTPKVTYVVGSNVKMLVSGGEERTYTLTCTNPNDRVVDHTSNVGPLGSVDVHSNSVDYHLKKIGAGYDVDLYINTITCEA